MAQTNAHHPAKGPAATWSRQRVLRQMDYQLNQKQRRAFLVSHQLHFTNNMLPYEQNSQIVSGMPPIWEPDVVQRQNIPMRIIDMGEDSLVPDDFSEEELQTGVWWRHLVAGGIAGAVSRTSTAPLDRVKVMLQVHGTSQGTVGIVPWFHKMLQEGGTKSLWRGNGVNVIKIAPESALKFTSYEQIKRWIKGGDSRRELKAHERFVAGSLAGVLSQTLIYPLEVVKTRLVIRNTGQYKGILDCAQHLYKTEGIKCFYRGYVPNIMGIIPYAGCDLMIYETLKRWYTRNHCQSGDPPCTVMVTCAGISSTFGQIVAYPLALVRTRLQAQTNQVQNRNMVQIFTDILKKEGPRGLYRGMAANFIKVIPSVSISYTIYELSLKKLNVKMS